MDRKELEERISARSYAIWEGEGRQEGRDTEYWERASREIEHELLEEALEGSNPQLVPKLRVSERPVRRDGHSSSKAA